MKCFCCFRFLWISWRPGTRVSVQGVESLWGDCRFIPADWGAHFLYRILDSKKTSRFQFSVPDLREIHRNLKQLKKINSHNGFFRRSLLCTFSCINPGFGGPWGMLWIFFLIGIFIMLQKNTFGQKKFQISCTGSKVPFWKNWKIAKMALLNRCMKFKIFFGQKYSFEA